MKKLSEIKNWQEMKGQIMHADCFEVMEKMPDQSCNLVIADPPYHKIVKNNFDNKFDNEEDFVEWQKKWIKEIMRILKKDGSFYIFGSIKNNALIKLKLWLDKEMIFKNWITWKKARTMQKGNSNFANEREEILFYVKSKDYYFKNPRGIPYKSLQSSGMYSKFILEEKPPYDKEKIKKLNDHLDKLSNDRNWFNKGMKSNIHCDGSLLGNVIEISNTMGSRWGKKKHINQKPVKLIEKFILASSKEGDLVFDPFGGSFSTAHAAKSLSRDFISCEIDEGYCKIGIQRMNQQNLF